MDDGGAPHERAARPRPRCAAAATRPRSRFATTAELEDVPGIIGQERAEEAVRFAIGIRRYGYNLYALGTSGMGKHGFVRAFLEQRAAARAGPAPTGATSTTSPTPRRPRALRLPPGRGPLLREDLQRLVEELRAAIPAVFESEDYRDAAASCSRRSFSEAGREGLLERRGAGAQRAASRSCARRRASASRRCATGEVMEPEAFQKLPEREQERIQAEMAAVQQELQEALGGLPREARRQREELRQLDRLVTAAATGHLVDEVRARWADVPAVLEHLAEVEKDVVDNAEDFLPPPEGASAVKALLGGAGREAAGAPLPGQRARHAAAAERRPGRLRGPPDARRTWSAASSTWPSSGNLVTDFTLIQAGALHRANGGYLIVDARRLLLQPLAWDELKRALRSKLIRIESLGQALSLDATASLEPEPIPLDVKVVLLGERHLYYLLSAARPRVPGALQGRRRLRGGDRAHAGRRAALRAAARHLRPPRGAAPARPRRRRARGRAGVAPRGRRREAAGPRARRWPTCCARPTTSPGEAGRDVVAAERTCRRRSTRRCAGRAACASASRRRSAAARSSIDTRGEAVGQVNGLSVLQLGGYAFGRPSRITARVRLGNGSVVDIEKEVALGGPIHSKGVLILVGLPRPALRLASGRSRSRPASSSSSRTPASRATAPRAPSSSRSSRRSPSVPVRQGRAITGSVNQHGQVQADRRREREDRGLLRRVPRPRA